MHEQSNAQLFNDNETFSLLLLWLMDRKHYVCNQWYFMYISAAMIEYQKNSKFKSLRSGLLPTVSFLKQVYLKTPTEQVHIRFSFLFESLQ